MSSRHTRTVNRCVLEEGVCPSTLKDCERCSSDSVATLELPDERALDELVQRRELDPVGGCGLAHVLLTKNEGFVARSTAINASEATDLSQAA